MLTKPNKRRQNTKLSSQLTKTWRHRQLATTNRQTSDQRKSVPNTLRVCTKYVARTDILRLVHDGATHTPPLNMNFSHIYLQTNTGGTKTT